MHPPPLKTLPQLSLLGCSPYSWTLHGKISLQFSSPSLIVYYITPSNRITEHNDNTRPPTLSLAFRVPRSGKGKRACSNCWRDAGQVTSACVNPAGQHVSRVEGERAISDSGISDGHNGCCNREGRHRAHRFPVSVLQTPCGTSDHPRCCYTREETTTAS